MMKRPASAVAMEKAEGGNPSSSSKPSKPSKPYKKPCAIAKVTNAKKTKKLEKPDSLDRQKGCSRCRWKSGCRSCNWRGCDKRKDHPKGTTQDDGERQHGYDDDDGESEKDISQWVFLLSLDSSQLTIALVIDKFSKRLSAVVKKWTSALLMSLSPRSLDVNVDVSVGVSASLPEIEIFCYQTPEVVDLRWCPREGRSALDLIVVASEPMQLLSPDLASHSETALAVIATCTAERF